MTGYHVSGSEVQPFDEAFGTRISVVPSLYCDVVFPSALSKFALEVTEKWPTFHHDIRSAAISGNLI